MHYVSVFHTHLRGLRLADARSSVLVADVAVLAVGLPLLLTSPLENSGSLPTERKSASLQNGSVLTHNLERYCNANVIAGIMNCVD